MSTFWTSIKNVWVDHKTLIIIIFLVVLNLILFQAFFKAHNTNKDLDNLINNQDSTIKTYKDQNGQLHTQIQIAAGNKDAIDIYYKKQIDSLSSIIKIKNNQILDYTRIIKTTSGSFATKIDTLLVHDTTIIAGKQNIIIDTNLIMPYKDNWLDFRGIYSPKHQSFDVNYTITDSLSFITFEKKIGFLNLGRTEYYLDVFSSNPNETITNLKSFKVIETPAKRFSIGPWVGVTYWGGNFTPVIGIGVGYGIIRF